MFLFPKYRKIYAKNLSFSLTLKGKTYIIILVKNYAWRVYYVILNRKSLDN